MRHKAQITLKRCSYQEIAETLIVPFLETLFAPIKEQQIITTDKSRIGFFSNLSSDHCKLFFILYSEKSTEKTGHSKK